jgi:Ca2+-binding RTX toxin-like protein
MEMTMIARNAARVPDTTLVTETPDFGEPVMVDIAGIEPIYGGSIGPVTSTPQASNSTLVGISGIDPVYGGSISPVTGTPDAPNPIVGTSGSDYLPGTSADDVIAGLDGKDWLYGLAGNDILDGGLGADEMAGGNGDDIYYVDDDGDVIWEWDGGGTDTVLLESVSGRGFDLPTAVENLVLTGSVREGYGNDFDNVITGNAADNVIHGRGGNDTIDGEFGNDVLKGGGGDDSLSGGDHNDLLDGGAGQETLIGGSGGDRFVWLSTDETRLAGQEADTVMDFNRAEGDLLDFSLIDADVTNGAQINDSFYFVGIVDVTQGGSFMLPGQIGYFTTGTDTYILLNTEVDAGIDYQDATIHLVGGHTVNSGWFVL